MKQTRPLLVALPFLLSACASTLGMGGVPPTIGESITSYTYIPLETISVTSIAAESCDSLSGRDTSQIGTAGKVISINIDGKASKSLVKLTPLLDSLPDTSVRFSVKNKTATAQGSIAAIASSVGYEGNQYQVVLDFITGDTINIPFSISKNNDNTIVTRIPETLQVAVESRAKFLSASDKNAADLASNVVVPIYLGVGLRLTAEITVVKGRLNLASLGAIAAAAEAQNATGTMVVQALGLSGKPVRSGISFNADLTPASVQQALQSLATVKAAMEDERSVIPTPRVTGMYLPIPANDNLINKIKSEIARYPVLWKRGCVVTDIPAT